MDITIILVLILINGLLSMSEIALVSVRRNKLEIQARQGDKSAAALLKLTAKPDRFLSMIQIGITLIGILNGLFSGVALKSQFAMLLERMGMSASWAGVLSPIIIVILVTYLTIVLGELVPKMIGLNRAEKVARIVTKPIQFLATMATPLVWLLSVSTNGIVKLLGIENKDDKLSEDEIKAMVNEGFQGGEVCKMERDIVENAFDLGDITVASVMTHRSDFAWIDITEPIEKALDTVRNTLHSVYPVCEGTTDNVKGVLHLKDFPLLQTDTTTFDPGNAMHPCNMVPESMTLYRCLENFRRENEEYAIVIDEYGTVQGIITLHDIMEVLVGEITVDEDDDDRVVVREDGSMLIDGQHSFYEFLQELEIDEDTDGLPYQTVGGLVLDILEHIPAAGEKVTWRDYTIEVVDMDGARIDKLLVMRNPPRKEEDKK